MRLICPTNPALEREAEKIWNMAFSNYVSPSKYEKWMDTTHFEEFAFAGGKKTHIERIKSLLKDQHDVRAGYMCTSIRGYYDYFIIWKP